MQPKIRLALKKYLAVARGGQEKRRVELNVR
jgi:hypothetical protein